MKTALHKSSLFSKRVKVMRPVSTAFDKVVKLYAENNLKKISSAMTMARNSSSTCKKFRKVLVKGSKASTSKSAQILTPRSPAKKSTSILVMSSVTTIRPNSTGNRTDQPLPAQQPVQPRLPMVLDDNSLKVPGTEILISPIAMNIVDHIVKAFRAERVEKLSVNRLLKLLNSSPASGTMKHWAIYNKGKPMGARQLNTILMTELGIHSFDLRIGASNKVVKGLHGRIFELLQVAFKGKTATISADQFLSKFPRSLVSVFDPE